jgi:hypothetical protein
MDDLLKSTDSLVRRADEMEHRAIAAERQLAAMLLGSDTREEG